MGDFTSPLAALMLPAREDRMSYETWCQCARLLLGWADGEGELRPDLFAAHLTPLAAAREMVLDPPPLLPH